MGRPLHLLEIHVEGGVVDGGRHLAHAAAQVVHAGAAVGVDGGGAVALFGGALAHHVVEGEDLAGVDDGAIDCLAGQAEILGAVGNLGVDAGAAFELGAEHLVVEGLGVQRRLGLQQGNGEGVALVGAGNLSFGGLQIEAVAADALEDGVGLFVIAGVLDLAHQCLMEAVDVGLLIGKHHIVPGNRLEFAGLEG